ncbi:MAG: Holliday junction resolvase RuvX [Candidatus Krumholzibacteria bacterium]|nr:Holliday junction resolvase RuvX [Candidatus Krumholzibacteria bacterium]
MNGSDDESVRILGIDPGEKRLGLAISDPLGVTAQGLDTFIAGQGVEFIDYLCGLISRYNIEVVVLGMPLSMGGDRIEGTERSRRLAERIREECRVEVVLRDERMTSLEAERVMKQEGRIRDPGDIDRMAAVLLLQGYLDEREG